MRDINLLPVEYQRKPPNRYLILFIVVLCLSAWPIVKYGFIVPSKTREGKAQHLAFMQEEIEKLPELEESFEQQKTKLEEMQNRMLAFQEIEEGSPQRWQDIFCTLKDSLPAGTYIQDFTCDNTSILLSGISCNDVTAAQYLHCLENSGFFSEVRMEKIIYRNSEEISFYLKCTLKLDDDEMKANMNAQANTQIKQETEEALP